MATRLLPRAGSIAELLVTHTHSDTHTHTHAHTHTHTHTHVHTILCAVDVIDELCGHAYM